MENTNNFITLALHSPSAALKLKKTLEFHGIKVVLKNITLNSNDTEAVQVCIPEESIPLGLKILESGQLNLNPLSVIKMSGMGDSLIIPIDFSDSSMRAIKVGFFLASKLSVKPVILHVYSDPLYNMANPFGNAFTDDTFEESIEARDLLKIVNSRMEKLCALVKDKINNNLLPDIQFSTEIIEGIPEKGILEYSRSVRPVLIVMSTRGIDKKESDLIGSVTAEVIDACKFPVLTVPDNYKIRGVENIKNVLFICSLTRFDLITLRGLMRTFDYPSCNFYLVPSHDIKTKALEDMENLKQYLSKLYPTANFTLQNFNNHNFDGDIKKLLENNNIQLIIAPNKKSSALTRFFRPTLAHKILFEKDIPILSLPYLNSDGAL